MVLKRLMERRISELEAWLHETIENDEQPDDVRLNYPAWLNGAFSSNLNANLEAELKALNSEATVDLRVNSLKTDRDTAIRLLADAGLNAVPMKFAPNGIRLSERRPFRHLQGFKDGLFEPQDEASQIAVELVWERHPATGFWIFAPVAAARRSHWRP